MLKKEKIPFQHFGDIKQTYIQDRKQYYILNLILHIFIVISSSRMTELLLGFNILVASTKTVRLVHWLFFQSCMYQFLHLSQKFSLLLLCSVGLEACSTKLKDGRFWSSQAKTSKIWRHNILLSRPTIHCVPMHSTPRMIITEESKCD